MELDIFALKKTIENVLSQSELSPEIKRLVLVEQAGKMAEKSSLAINRQITEVKKNAESV